MKAVEVWYRDGDGKEAVFRVDEGEITWSDYGLCVVNFRQGNKLFRRCFPVVNIVYVEEEV